MKLTINRQDWLRGEGSCESRLLREDDGKMCCLGFLSKQCGLMDDDIREVSDPRLLQMRLQKNSRLLPESVHWLTTEQPTENHLWNTTNSSIANDLMIANDDTTIGDDRREAKLKDLFAQQGIEVEFV